jgi:hypothetical protein
MHQAEVPLLMRLYDYGRAGRPKTKIDSTPPKGFSLHLGLMKPLEPHG